MYAIMKFFTVIMMSNTKAQIFTGADKNAIQVCNRKVGASTDFSEDQKVSEVFGVVETNVQIRASSKFEFVVILNCFYKWNAEDLICPGQSNFPAIDFVF